MPNFRQPDKTVSRAFVQNGIYVGQVTRVEESVQQVYVIIPRYVAGFEFGPLNVATSDLPRVGDSVACLFLENRQDDVMILGIIKDAETDVTVTPVIATSTTRPEIPRTGTIIYETDTENSYVWNGSTWISIGGGAQGPQGEIGAQGPQGSQGVQGSQGAQGSQGSQGLQGDQGVQGPQGFQGNQGPQGNQGAQGSQGPQGNQGSQGPQGYQGLQGDQGPQGSQGTQGFQGNQGPQGTQGTQGFQGDQGLQGPQGTQGFQGDQGLQGPQGNQGFQGPQGNQGPQGVQGAAGGVTTVAGTSNQVLVNGGTGAQSGAVTLSLPQDISTSSSPSFSVVNSTVATGTSPLVVASTTLVSNLNADLLDGQHANYYVPTGSINQYAGLTAPSGWLLCAGQSLSRSTYADLFTALTSSKGTVTMTIATPCVVTLNSHGLVAGDAIYLTTTGALPTGLTANTTYYVQNPGANTFNLNTSQANAISNSATGRVATSGSQSGTHTLVHAPWGGISASNFAIPDLRGRIGVGLDNMNGTDASRLSVTNALGYGSGAETHTLTISEIPSHDHALFGGASGSTVGLLVSGTTGTGAGNTDVKGGGGAHNNMQPYVLLNYIIKT